MTDHLGTAHHPPPRATAAGIGAILLWCSSGACIAVGSRALGTMPYLAITSAIGVVTAICLQPATCAGTAVISTELGYAARPPGT